MPLQPLQRIVDREYQDGTQVTRLPDNKEMIDKINEIVRFVNSLEKDKMSKPIEGRGVSFSSAGLRKSY